MNIEINKKYRMLIILNGTTLSYTGVVKDTNDNFITILDKVGKIVSIKKDIIQTIEEVIE